MRALFWACLALCGAAAPAHAWGPAAHSAIAEIAQHRLSPAAAAAVAEALGPGRSLASIASWADEVRERRPDTAGWHFVNIPLAEAGYDARTQCAAKRSGDCIVAELQRLGGALRCASGASERREALLWTVHLVGDIHQPLHTLAEQRGGNDVDVLVTARGDACTARCRPMRLPTSLHAAWDGALVDKLAWSWGGLVERLEAGWLRSADAKARGLDGGTPADWALDSHRVAQHLWRLTPPDGLLDDAYLASAAPAMERQIGVAGLRLAKVINDAYASRLCPRP